MILCYKDVYYDIEYHERNHIVSGSSGIVITIAVRANREPRNVRKYKNAFSVLWTYDVMMMVRYSIGIVICLNVALLQQKSKILNTRDISILKL